jgi:hypothetical protein
MGFFSKKKPRVSAPTTAPGRVRSEGKALHVNPSETMKTKNLKGRIRHIRMALDQHGDKYSPEKQQKLKDTLRRHEVTLILREGGKI